MMGWYSYHQLFPDLFPPLTKYFADSRAIHLHRCKTSPSTTAGFIVDAIAVAIAGVRTYERESQYADRVTRSGGYSGSDIVMATVVPI